MALLLRRIGRLQSGRLRAAITADWRAVPARLLHFDFRSRHVGDEFRILVQSFEHGLADGASGIDVALVVHPADHAALPELVGAGPSGSGSLRQQLGEHFAPDVAE